MAATPEIARKINDALPAALDVGQSIEVNAPTPELARLVSDRDAAVSAVGTSLWELLCLGVPTALAQWLPSNEWATTRPTSTGSCAGRRLIDGRGRVRVVDALQESITRSQRQHQKAAPQAPPVS